MNGRFHRLTAAELREVRLAFYASDRAARQRREVMARYGLNRNQFRDIGLGIAGKKPAREE